MWAKGAKTQNTTNVHWPTLEEFWHNSTTRRTEYTGVHNEEYFTACWDWASGTVI